MPIFGGNFFYVPLYLTNDLRWRYFFTIHYSLASLLYQRPPVAPSFVARRKIGEKGVPRRRKLHILRFAFRGKSSVVPLLLLSPPNPLALGFGGAPMGSPLNPRGNVLGHSDVLCAYLLATVHLTRLSRAWRAPHCFHALCVLRCQGHGTAYDFTGHRSTHESVETVCLPHATDGPKSR